MKERRKRLTKRGLNGYLNKMSHDRIPGLKITSIKIMVKVWSGVRLRFMVVYTVQVWSIMVIYL